MKIITKTSIISVSNFHIVLWVGVIGLPRTLSEIQESIILPISDFFNFPIFVVKLKRF
jgi:hypothetical protein